MPFAAVVLSGVIGLAACSSNPSPTPSPSPTAAGAPTVPAAPVSSPLPPPTALTDVLYRLSDPAVPGAEKVALVEYTTADDAAALDRFGRALADGGAMPLTIEATDLRWSEAEPGNVLATVTVTAANQQAGNFTFPMEFTPIRDSWQLNRKTADLLLELGPPATPATPTR
ncbi:MAG: hypothetical protein ACRDU5_22465 [Mycobacterium sp.]